MNRRFCVFTVFHSFCKLLIVSMDSRRQGNKCCVANCNDWSSKRHRFPKNEPEIFNMWLMSVNPPNYKSLSVQEIYTKFYVCDRHFSPDCIVPGTKRGLKKTAVPTLHIPGLSATQISPQIIPSQVRQETEPTRIVIQAEDEAGPSYIRSHSPIPTLTGITATLKIAHDPSSNVSRDIQTEEENPSDIRSRTPLPTFTGIIDVPETPKARSSHFSRGSRKRRMILNSVDVTRAADLTPKARKLYKTVCEWNTKINRIQRRVTSFQDRLALAEKADNSREFKKLMNYVNESTYNFILCQVRNQQLHPKGRRYTLDEKILALSLLKASGRGYKILSKIFSLPSKKTLTNLLNKIPFKPGVNKYMFKNLQKTVEKMSEQDRCCIIMFDELSIECGVNYNIKEDCITGLDDNGHKKKTELADHANVFMLRGLYKQWKQPISYTFSSGPIKSTILKQMIVEIVTECQNIGLSIIATVCDQGSANQAAINGLLQNAREKHVKTLTESKHFGFFIQNQEIIPLYDIPHLMKGLRNNLLTKNLHFVMDGEKKVAKWEHIEQFYYLDVSDPNRICSKLTDKHVLKDKINKMKVSCCTQVFSYTVGSLMKRIATWNIQDRNKLESEALETADLILFLDRLFDCLNSSSKIGPKSKPLKAGITENSVHEDFLKNALTILNSMKFFSNIKNNFVSTPSVKNFKFTIRGILYLKDILLKQKKCGYVLTRCLNQDPLENLFGLIRSYGFRNVNPNTSHFVDAFKNLIVNNFMSSHSPSSNCEEDISIGALDNLKSFLTVEVKGDITVDCDYTIPPLPSDISQQRKTKIGRCTLAYMAGFITKKVVKVISDCQNCKNNLFSVEAHVDEDFIEAREYQQSSLIRPGTYLRYVTNESLQRIYYILPRICHLNGISKILFNHLEANINFVPLNCIEHNIYPQILKIIIRCAMYWWCKQVNLILKGKSNKFAKFMASKPPRNLVDPVKMSAYKKFLKKRNFKK